MPQRLASLASRQSVCPAKRRVRHVFAAADQSVGLRQRLELRVEGECLVQCLGETLPACPTRPQCSGRFKVTDGRVASDCTFDQRQFTATETGAFTRRVVIGAARGLPGIDRNRLAIELRSPEPGPIGYWGSDRNRRPGDHIPVRRFSLAVADAHLPAGHCPGRPVHGSRYGNGGRTSVNDCNILPGQRGSCAAKPATAAARACSAMRSTWAPLCFAVAALASNSGPLPAITTRSSCTGRPALISACKTTGPGHARQCPAGEGQQQLAGAGTQNQFVVTDQPAVDRRLRPAVVSGRRRRSPECRSDGGCCCTPASRSRI